VNILLCTDGSTDSIQTAVLISEFKFSPDTRIVVLGVSENNDDVDKITTSMTKIEGYLSIKHIVSRKIRHGSAIEEIFNEALENTYDLVAVGGGGKQLGLLRPQVGSTTKKLARKLHTHFLVGRNVPEKIGKILFCVGGIAPASKTIKLGGEWTSKINAQFGLLHVIPTSKDNTTIGAEITKQGDRIITQSLQELIAAGIKNEITSNTKRGLVVDNVLEEIKKGGYELLVVGSHYQPGQDRWQETLLDDITDQLLNRSACSMLII
jgi:nucleotide-binding universal stress UspA family protein